MRKTLITILCLCAGVVFGVNSLVYDPNSLTTQDGHLISWEHDILETIQFESFWTNAVNFFDFNSSNAVNKVSGGVDGTPSNVTYSEGGVVFNGLDAVIQVTGDTSLSNVTEFTISAWVNHDGTAGNGFDGIYAAETDGNNSILVAQGGSIAGSTNIIFRVGNGSGSYVYTTCGELTPGTNHHVLVTYDGSEAATNRAKIYIDNIACPLGSSGTIPTSTASFSGSPRIGYTPTLTSYFDGSLDNVSTYNRKLTDAERSRLYFDYIAGDN